MVQDTNRFIVQTMMDLIEVAANDGIISQDEETLLKEINYSLDLFSKHLDNALSDGVITDDEREELLKLKEVLVNNALSIASDDHIISDDEMQLLMGFLLKLKIPKQ